MKWWPTNKRDADLDRELRSDLELEEEEQRENGLPPEEAHYAAQRALGNMLLIKERTREVWGWLWLEWLLKTFDMPFEACSGARSLHSFP
jgi:putative ABC transport system permease protein